MFDVSLCYVGVWFYFVIFGLVIGFMVYLMLVGCFGLEWVVYSMVFFFVVVLNVLVWVEGYCWMVLVFVGLVLVMVGNVLVFRWWGVVVFFIVLLFCLLVCV